MKILALARKPLIPLIEISTVGTQGLGSVSQ